MRWRSALSKYLESIWYGAVPMPIWLRLAETVYVFAMNVRRSLYRSGWKKSQRIEKTVIVIGNITAGGTGKTPLCIWLTRELERRGWRPGIVTRGYGAIERGPVLVDPNGNAKQFGDEAILLARATRVPVAIAQARVAGAKMLAEREDVDIVLTDDGLQHWALARDIEIAVIDGVRRFGNGMLIPAGPLREPISRLNYVDFVIANGKPHAGEIEMCVSGKHALRLGTGERRCLASFVGQSVHAVAGIGNPERFFSMLEVQGLTIVRHAFADHHPFSSDDLKFSDRAPILMTEKDAVKCESDLQREIWIIPIEVELPDSFANEIHCRLIKLKEARNES